MFTNFKSFILFNAQFIQKFLQESMCVHYSFFIIHFSMKPFILPVKEYAQYLPKVTSHFLH